MTAKILAGVALLAMFEDVEIMRQLVERAVDGVYKNALYKATVDKQMRQLVGLPQGQFASFDAKKQTATGVYLPGYGALIQLSAPMPFAETSAKQNGQETELTTLWETARREFRGEASERKRGRRRNSEPARGPTRAELTRAVLDVLAQNGRNFRELSAQERVTVDITFRDRADTHYVVSLGLQDKSPFAELGNDAYHGMPTTLHPQGNPYQQPNTAAELTGDLHMRQKNYKKAVEAYRSALGYKLERRNDESASQKQQRSEELESLMRKVAQAEVAAERYEQAADLLKMLADQGASRKGLEDQAAVLGLRSSHAPAAKLPAHLIISATKAQLDAVATGKMSREEFARAAQVDYLDPRVAAAEVKRQKTGTDASE